MYKTLLLLLGFAFSSGVFAEEPMSKHRKTGVTIGGHDTVAYHQPENIAQHKARKGRKKYAVEYKGVIWQFDSAENQQAFLTDPERYRPAYGGYCANALSLGEGLIPTNGKTWEIFEDQLFVFYAPRGRKRWHDGNWQTYKQDADRAWSELVNE